MDSDVAAWQAATLFVLMVLALQHVAEHAPGAWPERQETLARHSGTLAVTLVMMAVAQAQAR